MDGGNSGGGSSTLGRLIDEYGEFIAADLMEYYRVDLRGLFTGELSPGYLLVLITNLPTTSRFYAEQRGGQHFRGWDESRYLMVAVVNAVRALQYTYIAAHSKTRPKPPEPFPTPESLTSKPKVNTFALIAAAKMAESKRKAG